MSQFCGCWLSFSRPSAQPILSFDLRGFETADPGVNARASGHYQGEQNFVGAWGIGQADFHGVEMTSYIRSIDVRDGYIEPCARAANLLRGRHDRFRVAQNFAHSVAAGYVPQRTVLEFAGGADDSPLAIAFHNLGISAQRGDEGARHFEAQRFEVIHEAGNLFHVYACKWIVDDCQRGGTAQRRGRNRSALVKDFFNRREFLPNLDLGHEPDSPNFRVYRLVKARVWVEQGLGLAVRTPNSLGLQPL